MVGGAWRETSESVSPDTVLDGDVFGQKTAGAGHASRDDITYLYNFILRRDPESDRVVDERVGISLTAAFEMFVGAHEFSDDLRERARTQKLAARAYSGPTNFRKLMTWAADALPLAAQVRPFIATAASWEEVDLLLMEDSDVSARVSALVDPDVRRGVELRGALGLSEASSGSRAGRDFPGSRKLGRRGARVAE